jgi:hypothetical protein
VRPGGISISAVAEAVLAEPDCPFPWPRSVPVPRATLEACRSLLEGRTAFRPRDCSCLDQDLTWCRCYKSYAGEIYARSKASSTVITISADLYC